MHQERPSGISPLQRVDSVTVLTALLISIDSGPFFSHTIGQRDAERQAMGGAHRK
jgi:hypothetical protein